MRVIAGKWRGRTLRAPRGFAVRPTLDRVREAVFGILGARVEGAAVLDLFAGTGAMALEALSRGAASAVLVEADPKVCEVLRRNVLSLGAEGAAVTMPIDFRRAARTLRVRDFRFDLVFLDPPYGKGLAAAAAGEISKAGIVLPGASVVVEEAVRSPESGYPEAWERSADRTYGETRIVVFDVPAARRSHR